jgi:2-oxoglutarate dehydrogenase E1 component
MAVETTVEVVMPAMGDSVSEGTVLEWHKQEGDTIAADETLVEISTDKVDAEVPAPIGGTIVKVHASEGAVVEVGGLLAEIAPNGSAPEATSNGGPPAAPEQAPDQLVDITMPAMGESVTEASCSSGTSNPARPWRPTRRSSRSRRTRWTPRSPRPRAGR